MSSDAEKYEQLSNTDSSSSSSESDSSDDSESDNDNELTQREKNRAKTMQRSRMWITVGSSDEEDQDEEGRKRQRDSEGDSGSHKRQKMDASEAEREAGKDKKPKRKQKKKDKKKKKKDKKKKKKKKKQDEKDKKKKKKKKEKKEKDRSKLVEDVPSANAINQNEYGRYGIIKESDFFRMQRSFEAWLMEVKKVADLGGSKRETMEYFNEYMEDFNTVTLPHKKYYDFDKWEMAEYQKKQKKEMKKKGKRSAYHDEEERRREIAEKRKRKEEEDFKLIMSTMDKDKINAMRSREHLISKMQLCYRSGNLEEARQIEAQLQPDEDEETMKYKHKSGQAEKTYIASRNW